MQCHTQPSDSHTLRVQCNISHTASRLLLACSWPCYEHAPQSSNLCLQELTALIQYIKYNKRSVMLVPWTPDRVTIALKLMDVL